MICIVLLFKHVILSHCKIFYSTYVSDTVVICSFISSFNLTFFGDFWYILANCSLGFLLTSVIQSVLRQVLQVHLSQCGITGYSMVPSIYFFYSKISFPKKNEIMKFTGKFHKKQSFWMRHDQSTKDKSCMFIFIYRISFDSYGECVSFGIPIEARKLWRNSEEGLWAEKR